ncbi:MAG TPA: transposase [Alphaproteobacteria bacterium]|mgnify:CR=1 FL=1|nr:transposase [Alphaproteobacteria bacterium]
MTANHKKTNYTKEFKEEAANLFLKHGRTCHEAGRGLGIAPSNVNQSGYYDYSKCRKT